MRKWYVVLVMAVSGNLAVYAVDPKRPTPGVYETSSAGKVHDDSSKGKGQRHGPHQQPDVRGTITAVDLQAGVLTVCPGDDDDEKGDVNTTPASPVSIQVTPTTVFRTKNGQTVTLPTIEKALTDRNWTVPAEVYGTTVDPNTQVRTADRVVVGGRLNNREEP